MQFNNLHDTFGRDVTIYKTSKKIEIATTQDYISVYRNNYQGDNFKYQYEAVSGVFPMRVNWISPKEERDVPFDIDAPNQVCRLKMKKDAFDFLSGYQSLFIDGVSCELMPGFRPHGLFNVDFYTVYAKRRDMQ